MFTGVKSKYQQLQDYTRDFNEYKNNEHIWDLELTTQINDEQPKKPIKNCFLKAWIAYIFCNLTNQNFGPILNNAGGSSTMQAKPTLGQIKEGLVAGEGIIVGTDNTAVDVADNAMGTIIPDGTAAGNLLYGATSVAAFKADADDEISWNISKSMHNRSGGTITVEEIGLLMNITATVGTPAFLIDRTLSTNVLLDGDRLTVTYHFKQT